MRVYEVLYDDSGSTWSSHLDSAGLFSTREKAEKALENLRKKQQIFGAQIKERIVQ